MLTIIFAVALIWIAGKMLAIGLRVAWGVAKTLLPLLLVIGLVYIGLIYLTFPALIIFGVVILLRCFAKA